MYTFVCLQVCLKPTRLMQRERDSPEHGLPGICFCLRLDKYFFNMIHWFHSQKSLFTCGVERPVETSHITPAA